MNYTALYSFLSEQNVKQHLSYMREIKLKYSILEKSIPSLSGLDRERVLKLNLPKKQQYEIFPLIYKIKAHEIFFSSFTKEPKSSPILRKYYSSENDFCYRLKEAAKREEYGYLVIFKDGRGKPCFKVAADPVRDFSNCEPLLIIDLYEHAYFADYSYGYEKYLNGAISHLDFSRLQNKP